MDSKVDNILKELFKIDPSLKEREGDLRVLVTTLIDAKPSISINEAFMLSLKERLLDRASHMTHKPASSIPSLSWWAFRLAPIGAFAILMLMLLPPQSEAPSPIPLPYNSGTENMEIDMYRNMNMDMDASQESIMTKQAAPQIQGNQNSVTLNSVSTKQGGFVVLHMIENGMPGEIIGVSKFLPPGTTVGVQINLFRALYETETYQAYLYADNGDGVYSEKDIMIQTIQ